MGRYINWSDVVGRYPEVGKGKDATTVDSSYIPAAEGEIESRLGARFTIPFSSNNLTVMDLAIDLVYAKAYRFKDPKKASAVDSYVYGRISGLLNGTQAMVAKDGTFIEGSVEGTIYSTTQNYNPIFTVDDTTLQDVDSSYLDAERNARGQLP